MPPLLHSISQGLNSSEIDPLEVFADRSLSASGRDTAAGVHEPLEV